MAVGFHRDLYVEKLRKTWEAARLEEAGNISTPSNHATPVTKDKLLVHPRGVEPETF
jgi:hypothetical protein